MPPSGPPHDGRLRRATFLVALTIDALGTGLFLPFSILFFIEVHGLGIAQTGLLADTAGVVALVVLPGCGALLDQVGPQPFAIANFALRAAGFITYLATGNMVVLAFAFAAVAVGDRSWPPASQLYVAALVEPQRRTIWLGISRSCRMAGMAAGTLVAGLVATVWGTEGLLALAAANATTFVLGALLLVSVPVVGTRPSTTESLVTQMRTRSFQRIFAALAPSTIVYVAVLTILPIFIVESMGGPAWMAAAVVTINTVTTVGGQVPLLTVARRMGDRRSLIAGSALIGAGYALLAVVPAIGGLGVVIAGGLLGALVISVGADLFYPSSVSYLSEVAADGSQGRWLASYQMEFALANGVGLAALTALLDTAPGLLWPLLTVAMIVAVLAQSRLPLVGRRPDATTGTVGR